jgi:hypothetical protein
MNANERFAQFGRGPLHKWKNEVLKKEVLNAGANYQFKAAELLGDIDYREWLKSGEPSDDEEEDERLVIGHTNSAIDKALSIRSQILRAKRNDVDDNEEEGIPDLERVSNKRGRGSLIDDEAGEDR